MADCLVRDRLPELWQMIDNAHFSYLETDDCLEKLDQRKKLEGYIMDYLCLVPHERKFRLPETSQVFQKSAIELPDFSGYRAASGWAALAQYAGNLLAQPWRKEYRVIRLYSGFFKHEVEANLAGGEVMLRVMGYRPTSANCLELDGPICPDLVAAVSRDSLIAYVECQLMKAVWEELCRRGCSRGWREVLAQRQRHTGDARCAIAALLPTAQYSRDSHINATDDSIIHHNMPSKILPSMQTCGRQSLMAQQTAGFQAMDSYNHMEVSPPSEQQPSYNEHLLPSCLPSSQYQPVQVMAHLPQTVAPTYCPNSFSRIPNGMHSLSALQRPDPSTAQYSFNRMGMVHPYSGIPGYYFAPVNPHPYMMQYAPIRQATTVPINGYHCMPNVANAQPHNTVVPTGQLIELDLPNQHVEKPLQNGSSKNVSHHQRNIPISTSHSNQNGMKERRSQPKASSSENIKPSQHYNGKRHEANGEKADVNRRTVVHKVIHIDHDLSESIPRSDTQPTLSKAKEDGMGTFESWDYVFKNLESQGYSKDLGERGDLLIAQSERDSRTLDRGLREKRYAQQTAMDLEDALHAMSIEKSSDEEIYRTAKINDMLMKIKHEKESKMAKINARKQILADEREKRKIDTSVGSVVDKSAEFKVTDKTRLISKEDARDKKEIDKLIYINGHGKNSEARKPERNTVACFGVDDREKERTSGRRKPVGDLSAMPSTSRMAAVQAPKKKTSVDNPQVSRSNSSQVSSRALSSSNAQQTDRLSPDPNMRLVVTLRERDTVDGEHQTRKLTQELAKPVEPKPTADNKRPPRKAENVPTKWQCGTCTYLNGVNMAACEMCGKSRNTGSECTPLVSGGKECPACTLVNKRDAAVCEACNSSLKYSPTYI